MTRKTIIATVAAMTLSSAVLAGPALAGGSVSFTYTPTNAKDAQMLKMGLSIYSIYQYSQANGGGITQKGIMNAAGLGQNGSGNLGVIYQKGNGNTGTLQQNGNNNSYGIFQFGNGGNTAVTQNGNGQSGITIQGSW
jgi:hypothetical protein